MSRLFSASAACPKCETTNSIEYPASVNADRRPDLRHAILDQSLYTLPCRSCGQVLTFEPHMTYLDVQRGQWILADASDAVATWREAEAHALGVYDLAFGSGAPSAARTIGGMLSPRLVFGWPALIEKLVCQELAIDDTALEALKMVIIKNAPGDALDLNMDLRLCGRSDDMLELAWIDPLTGAEAARMRLPEAAYERVGAGGPDWAPLVGLLAGRMFVDIGRVLHDSPAPQSATAG